jgi:orotate phosphoribosyltransferase
MDLIGKEGHFLLESGHHGERWFDLDTPFSRPATLQPAATELARRLAPYRPTIVCGPLTGGAFLAQLVALALGGEFVYTERTGIAEATGELFSARYRLPASLRASVRDARVALVDDALNAGSALRATAAELTAHGATLVACGALLVLGHTGADWVANQRLPLVALERHENTIWSPDDCPLCAAGIPLARPGASPS